MTVAGLIHSRHNSKPPALEALAACNCVTRQSGVVVVRGQEQSRLIAPRLPKQEACSMQIHDIQALVAARMGVTVLDILSARQTQAACRPRHVAMWLARHTTTYSLPAIGLAFGNRDHTTVMNGVARTDERMAADPALAAAVLAMRNIITSRLEAAA